MSFGERLNTAIAEFGPLCVGIDPHPHLLEQWGLALSAEGAAAFGRTVVEAAVGRVGIVKPQVAFFEAYGSAGFRALESVLDAARSAGLVVIADAKRGDIGTTMAGYARAWLEPGAPLEADALTVSSYLGFGALEPALAMAATHGKGLFVLAATSNREASEIQRAQRDERSVAALVYDEAVTQNSAAAAAGRWGSVGVVIGATVDLARAGLGGAAQLDPATPILAPGFGAQGADPADLTGIFGAAAGVVVASESRSVLSAGPAEVGTRIAQRAGLYRRGEQQIAGAHEESR